MVYARNDWWLNILMPTAVSWRSGGSMSMRRLGLVFLALFGIGLGNATLLAQPKLPNRDPALATLLQADRTNVGSEDLQIAWQAVSQWPAGRLGEVLEAVEEANPVSLNWMRSAIDGMMERPEFQTPTTELVQVVQDTNRKYASRRIAWELLDSADPGLMESITDHLITDPIAAFRRPAIEKQIALANTLEKKSAERKKILLEAFQSARDEDQVGSIARVLDLEYGEKPDLAKHFGFVINWHVVGPFANIEEAGFHEVYSPELLTASDFDGNGTRLESLEYTAMDRKLRWQKQLAIQETGELDLNQCLGKEKEVVGYGVAVFNSDDGGPAEIRLRMQNAFKLWFNGDLIQSQPIGHTGNSFDQYVNPVTLKKGQNMILIKSCQNKPPQEIEWYDTWHFNVRICDSSGTAIQEGKK